MDPPSRLAGLAPPQTRVVAGVRAKSLFRGAVPPRGIPTQELFLTELITVSLARQEAIRFQASPQILPIAGIWAVPRTPNRGCRELLGQLQHRIAIQRHMVPLILRLTERPTHLPTEPPTGRLMAPPIRHPMELLTGRLMAIRIHTRLLMELLMERLMAIRIQVLLRQPSVMTEWTTMEMDWLIWPIRDAQVLATTTRAVPRIRPDLPATTIRNVNLAWSAAEELVKIFRSAAMVWTMMQTERSIWLIRGA